MNNEGRGVQSVEVGARLLEALSANAKPMMLRDIARQANIAPAQAHAYLLSFRRLHLVEQVESSGYYRLGPLALQLAIARLRSSDVVRMANAAGADLARETSLSVAIVVWGSYGPTVIYVHEGADQVSMNTRPGTVYSLTGTATGLVFAAYLPEKLARQTLKAQRSERGSARFVGDLPDLSEKSVETGAIRRRGYSVIDSHPIPGVSAVAAPVFDVAGQLQLVVTLIGAVNVIDIKANSWHVEKVRELARTLSSRMGFRPTPADNDPAPPSLTAQRAGRPIVEAASLVNAK
jgi:DNA-binding IclR family transcriptional regulator